MKLAGIIVVYNPNYEQLISNIFSLIDDVDILILYQNSKIVFDESILSKLSYKVILLGDAENKGIATALNDGVKWAIQNNFTHVLTLDQDSCFYVGHLKDFKKLIINSNLINVGVYCPNICNHGNLLISSDENHIKVPDSITSGSIFPIKVFSNCGFFEDKLFIDAVDYEFCYRIYQQKKLITIIFPKIILKHEVGYPTKIRFGLITDNYSSFRTYFIIRNHIIIWKRYPHLFQKSYKKTLIKIHICYRLIKILIGEENKKDKVISIFKGMFHGMLNKL